MHKPRQPFTLLGLLPATRSQVADLYNLCKGISMDQKTLGDRLDAANARAQKVAAEQAAALQALRDEMAAGGPISAEVEAKLVALESTIQSQDDLNPDATTEQPTS